MTLWTKRASDVKSGDYITIPGVTADKPLLVEHVTQGTEWANPDWNMVEITVWPSPALETTGEVEERAAMATLSLMPRVKVKVHTGIDAPKPSVVPFTTRPGQVIGRVQSVRDSAVTASSNVVRVITLTSGVEYRTAPDSSSGYDAANLHPGDNVTLTLQRARVTKIEVQPN